MTDKSQKSAKDYLRPEDRILWETVAKTAKPLAGKKPAVEEEFPDFKAVMAQEADKNHRKSALAFQRASDAKKAYFSQGNADP